MPVAGIVPLTPAMQTLAPRRGPPRVHPRSRAPSPSLLPDVAAASDKPLLAVVDSGVLFDPLADALQAGGLPVFRSADRAVRALCKVGGCETEVLTVVMSRIQSSEFGIRNWRIASPEER